MRKLHLLLILMFVSACRAPTTATLPPSSGTHPPASATPTEQPSETPEPQEQGLLLDGEFSDWESFEPLYVDPQGDGGASGVDIGAIYTVHSDTHLIFKIELGRMVDLDEEPALIMQVEQEGGPSIRYDFGAREGSFNGLKVNHAGLGIIDMPTYSSDTYEIAVRLNRFSPEADLAISFADPAEDGDQAPDTGGAIAYDWRSPLPPVEPLAIEKADPAAIRFMTYNIPNDGILDPQRAEVFERIFKTISPDVILIQEARNRLEGAYAEKMEEWLGGDWFAGKQRDLIIASRLPFIDGWQEPGASLDVRIFPVMLDADNRQLVVMTAHMSCCAFEDDRQDEVDGFIRYLREGSIPAGTPFLLMGDLNLVGSAQPLHTLLDGDIADEGRFGQDYTPDWDVSPLAALALRHANSRMTFTWNDPANSYAPGRLDYFVYTDSLLEAGGFILDTSEMPEDLLNSLGLQTDDTADASDHLPVVVDVTFSASQ